jgi:hypothetical protein
MLAFHKPDFDLGERLRRKEHGKSLDPNDFRRHDLAAEINVAQRNWTWRSAEPVRLLKKEGKWRFAAVDPTMAIHNSMVKMGDGEGTP